MTLEEEIRRGEQAQALLDSDVLNQAMSNIEADCLLRWRASAATDTEGRERIWQLLKMTDAVKLELQNFVSRGKQATAKVDHEKKARAFEKERGFRPHY